MGAISGDDGAAPVEVCPEDRIGELEREREDVLKEMRRFMFERDRFAFQNTELRAELAAAKDQALSATDAYETLYRLTHPALSVAHVADPEHNPFREFSTDRRRLGG